MYIYVCMYTCLHMYIYVYIYIHISMRYAYMTSCIACLILNGRILKNQDGCIIFVRDLVTMFIKRHLHNNVIIRSKNFYCVLSVSKTST